ncbi:hypothetical protein [Actinophytocola xanthii]|uniref:hypothetical protein n=1 Tax=Actinophytocola xanthii TaxID=1912961 RepID=UPI001178A6DB|nr:hypothetical protein [Actinophytocola xanthii]
MHGIPARPPIRHMQQQGGAHEPVQLRRLRHGKLRAFEQLRVAPEWIDLSQGRHRCHLLS